MVIMGKILSLKTTNNERIQVNLELTQDEALWLQGNLEHMHLFSEKNLEYETRLIKRGKRESTKYFLLPRELRDTVKPTNKVLCNKISTKTKNILIFSVPKYTDGEE